jgi:hypothetical protein
MTKYVRWKTSSRSRRAVGMLREFVEKNAGGRDAWERQQQEERVDLLVVVEMELEVEKITVVRGVFGLSYHMSWGG